MGVTDSFERANENPLSNGGKWSEVEIPAGLKSKTGLIFESQWGATTNSGKYQGGYWNTAEQTNPAVSVELSEAPTFLKDTFGVLACVDATAKKYYMADAVLTNVAKEEYTVRIRKFNVGFTTLQETAGITFKIKDRIAITVRGGVVTAWRYSNATTTWGAIASVVDASYTKGFSGFLSLAEATEEASVIPHLHNFSTGEAPGPPAESEFTSLLPCSTSGGKFLIAASGTHLFSVTEKGEITSIGEGFTEGARWSLVQAEKGTRVAKGPIYLSNGTDAPQSWTGAAKNTATTAWTSKAEGEFVEVPKAKYLIYFANRVWAAGMSTEKSTLRFSGFVEPAENQADPTNWPKKNFVRFDEEDGQEITGLGISGPYLLVFKEHKVWTVFDLNEGENRRISDTSGAIAWRSIVETPVGTFYLTPDQGVFLTNGAKVQEMSKNVRNLLQGFDPITGREDRAAKLNELHNAAAEYLNGHYYLSYMAQDSSIKTLDYDTLLKSWWLHDLGGNQWVHWEPTAGSSALYTIPHKAKGGIVKAFVPGIYQDSGANYTGKKLEVLQHSGETITVTPAAYWASCWEPFWQYFMRHRFQQPQIKKRIRTLFVDGKGEVEGYAWRNFGTKPQRLQGVVENADVALQATYTPKPGNTELEYQAVRFYSLGTGRVWSFMFANQTAEPFEVDTYAADIYFRKA